MCQIILARESAATISGIDQSDERLGDQVSRIHFLKPVRARWRNGQAATVRCGVFQITIGTVSGQNQSSRDWLVRDDESIADVRTPNTVPRLLPFVYVRNDRDRAEESSLI
jgi:hypothetical protein